MTKGEIGSLALLLTQLIALIGGNKPKKKALAVLPKVNEMVLLWPTVRLVLEAAALENPEVARFRQLVDESVALLK